MSEQSAPQVTPALLHAIPPFFWNCCGVSVVAGTFGFLYVAILSGNLSVKSEWLEVEVKGAKLATAAANVEQILKEARAEQDEWKKHVEELTRKASQAGGTVDKNELATALQKINSKPSYDARLQAVSQQIQLLHKLESTKSDK